MSLYLHPIETIQDVKSRFARAGHDNYPDSVYHTIYVDEGISSQEFVLTIDVQAWVNEIQPCTIEHFNTYFATCDDEKVHTLDELETALNNIVQRVLGVDKEKGIVYTSQV